MEHWLPLFYDHLETLFDYLPDDALIALDHLVREAQDRRWALITDAHEARDQTERKTHYRALPPGAFISRLRGWDRALGRRRTHPVQPFHGEG